MARKEWSESKKKFFYAVVRWTPEDVMELRPDWTADEAEEWLADNAKYVEDEMVRAGREVIEQLLPGPMKEGADGEG